MLHRYEPLVIYISGLLSVKHAVHTLYPPTVVLITELYFIFFLFLASFNHALSKAQAQYLVRLLFYYGRLIELGRMWKGIFMALFKVLCQHFWVGTEKTIEVLVKVFESVTFEILKYPNPVILSLSFIDMHWDWVKIIAN